MVSPAPPLDVVPVPVGFVAVPLDELELELEEDVGLVDVVDEELEDELLDDELLDEELLDEELEQSLAARALTVAAP